MNGISTARFVACSLILPSILIGPLLLGWTDGVAPVAFGGVFAGAWVLSASILALTWPPDGAAGDDSDDGARVTPAESDRGEALPGSIDAPSPPGERLRDRAWAPS